MLKILLPVVIILTSIIRIIVHFLVHFTSQQCRRANDVRVVPPLSCLWAAGRHSQLESSRPRLWCTGPAVRARCADWSHIRWSLAGSRRAVASAWGTPPGQGENRQTSGLICAPWWPKNQSSSKNTSTMGVCSERTRGTKMMESSSESLTMKMKPRLNMQVAAACWTLPHSVK